MCFKWLSQESFARNTNESLRTGGENGAPSVSMFDMSFRFTSSIDLMTSRVAWRRDEHGAVDLSEVRFFDRHRDIWWGRPIHMRRFFEPE